MIFIYLSCSSHSPFPLVLWNEVLTSDQYPPMTWLHPNLLAAPCLLWIGSVNHPPLLGSVLLPGLQCFTRFIICTFIHSLFLPWVLTHTMITLWALRYLCWVQQAAVSPSLARVPLGPWQLHLSSRFCCASFHSSTPPSRPLPHLNTIAHWS